MDCGPLFSKTHSCKDIDTGIQIPSKLAWVMTLSRMGAMDKLFVIDFDPVEHQIPPSNVVLDYLKNICKMQSHITIAFVVVSKLQY